MVGAALLAKIGLAFQVPSTMRDCLLNQLLARSLALLVPREYLPKIQKDSLGKKLIQKENHNLQLMKNNIFNAISDFITTL